MNAIVAVCENWGIGRGGALLVRCREDLIRFSKLTAQGTVIMGRKTYESLPGGALAGRRNIVLSRAKGFSPADAEVAHDICELRALIGDLSDDTLWLIGGGQIYELLLGECERAYVTKFGCAPEADAFFPDLDADPAWIVERTEPGGVSEKGIPFEYVTYRRISA